MKFRISSSARALGVLLSILLTWLFLTAFSIPSPDRLRSEIRSELKKIKESTPGAKALARWKELRAEAVSALKEASIQGAPEYAEEQYTEAEEMLRLARRYAAKKSYKKASYLARKAAETARNSARIASEKRSSIEKALKKRLEILGKRLEKVGKHILPGGDFSEKLAELRLEWGDIRNAILLGDYTGAREGISSLETEIERFSREAGISLDDEEERWQETI